MSFYDEYRKRFETPSDRLYCPYCGASDDNWESVFYNTNKRSIVGCDACIWQDPEEEGDCTVCGAKATGLFRDKTTKEIVGCDNCISFYNYADCDEYLKEEML